VPIGRAVSGRPNAMRNAVGIAISARILPGQGSSARDQCPKFDMKPPSVFSTLPTWPGILPGTPGSPPACDFDGSAFDGSAFDGLAFDGLAFDGSAFDGSAFAVVGALAPFDVVVPVGFDVVVLGLAVSSARVHTAGSSASAKIIAATSRSRLSRVMSCPLAVIRL
jgi:hypothetical protein